MKLTPITPETLARLALGLVGTPIQGPTGKSAYQFALDNGFVGTVAEWLEHLRAKQIEMRLDGDYIQWRYENGMWTNLIPVADLKGDKGDKGDQGNKGDKGDQGDMVDLVVGTVQQVSPSSPAEVTVVGTGTTRTLNFKIPQGLQGTKGDTGDRAWTPVLTLVADGERRVFSVDWANGSGPKPVTGYLSPMGVVSNIADAMNVRGAQGAAGEGIGDMVAANNLSEVDPEAARENLQAAHEGGNARFLQVNFGTAGAQLFTDNDGSLLVHTGSPALTEAYFDFDRSGNLTSHQGSFFTPDGEVWHPGNLNPSTYMPKSGGAFTGNVSIARGNAYTTFAISANAGQNKRVLFQTNDVNRWYIGSSSAAEGGSNAGSNFDIGRYDDSGSTIDVPFSINRQTGYITANPFYQQLKVFSANQTDTLLLERSNTGNNFIAFKTSADTKRLGVVGANLIFQDAGGTNRTVYHSGNFSPDDKLNTHNPLATGYMRIPNIQLNDVAGTYRALKFTTNGQDRWGLLMENSAETGTSSGGALWLVRGDNTGATSNVMHFERANGNVTIFNTLFVNGPVVTNTLNGGSTGITVQGSGEFNIGGSGGLRIGGNKLRFGTTASTEGLTYSSGTLYLENNRNFSVGGGTLFASKIELSANGTGNNIKIGDDATIGDGNVSNGIKIRGLNNTSHGYISFGNSGQTIGWDGSKHLIGGVQFSTANVVTAVDFSATSDERLKTNWKAVPEGWTAQLPDVKNGTFDWVDGSGSLFGVSAQELRKIFPAAVTEDADGYLSVSYGPAALMASIDLARRVARLEALVEQLTKGAL